MSFALTVCELRRAAPGSDAPVPNRLVAFVSNNQVDAPEDGPSNPSWQNWGHNQNFRPDRILHPATEDEVQRAVVEAITKGETIRAAGSGHSYTPVVETPHTLLKLDSLAGLVSVDREDRNAVVRAGTKLSAMGEPLWNAGLALANQGDTHGQTISGATATGTKGSGKELGSLSSMIRGMRLVDGTGELRTIDGTDEDLLSAAQVSLGLLGVVTELSLDVVPAYRLQESNEIMDVEELLSQWDRAANTYRHFSFFWCPGDASSDMYSLPHVPRDHAWVKFLSEDWDIDEVETGRQPLEGPLGRRNGRSYLIYPDVSDSQAGEFVELEYMVHEQDAKDAFLAVRHLMLTQYPNESPVQVRWQRADSAFLSPQYERPSVSISVSGVRARDFHKFLRAVDAELRPYGARPHWGKMHYLTPTDLRNLYPELDRFLALRKQFDPKGVFLNDHLREIGRASCRERV